MAARIPRLRSGGLITNYFCTSRCRHCAYYSGPEREKDYIRPETAADLLRSVRQNGCRSLHIGGGEPLLRPDKLMPVLREFDEAGVAVEYIETNCSWHKDPDRTEILLKELITNGVSTLLISISPFHNEYVPFSKTEAVMKACRRTGMGIFPWVESFIPHLRHFDPASVHSIREYENEFGEGYLQSIPGRYWVSLRGRALETYKPFMRKQSTEEITAANIGGCAELFDVSHFHVDLYGNYIPGLCTGLSIQVKDLQLPLSAETYPYLTALMTGGIGALTRLAKEEHGFVPKNEYASKCDLCYDIRRCLAIDRGVDSPDLRPRGYYSGD